MSQENPQKMALRKLSLFDRALIEAQGALANGLSQRHPAARANPADGVAHQPMSESDRAHAAGLMRINHAGEVCAQALYRGQAAVAQDPKTRCALEHAAAEEGDHLAWCADRLQELDSRGSVLNPLWYAGSYLIGVAAGLYGDGYNLGFVVETERQVEAHLGEHLLSLPPADQRSRAIVKQMQVDEAAHGAAAQAAGARSLPSPVPSVMQAASLLMKSIAYRF